MPLWLEHLLDDPGLGLVLVAGRAGIGARRPIRWAHISEIPDPTPWLEGGELLLTTGLAVKDNPDAQRRLITGLVERGCAGVGFGVGVWLEEVPAVMLAEADARGLPLFTVPYQVPFIAVTKRVSRHVFDEHYTTLRSAVELHRQVLAAVLADRGIAGVLATFAGPMPDFTCVVFDYFGQPLATSEASGTDPGIDPTRLWDVVADARTTRKQRFERRWEQRRVTAVPIRLGDQAEAVLALVGGREMLEHEQLLLEQGLAGISLELARGLSLREARRARVEELLGECDEGALAGRSAGRQLARLGLDPAGAYQVLCLQHPKGLSERRLCALVEDATVGSAVPLVGRHKGDVYCIATPPLDDNADRIAQAVEIRGWTRMTIGKSRVHQGAEALRGAMREARTAAHAPAPAGGGRVRDVSALGLTGLLAGIHDAAASTAFVHEVLGPVLDYDAAEGADLTGSLRAYLRHGCRPGPAAEELHVHRHTLTYRLNRIQDLTGRDPRDGGELLAYGLALELHASGVGKD